MSYSATSQQRRTTVVLRNVALQQRGLIMPQARRSLSSAHSALRTLSTLAADPSRWQSAQRRSYLIDALNATCNSNSAPYESVKLHQYSVSMCGIPKSVLVVTDSHRMSLEHPEIATSVRLKFSTSQPASQPYDGLWGKRRHPTCTIYTVAHTIHLHQIFGGHYPKTPAPFGRSQDPFTSRLQIVRQQ